MKTYVRLLKYSLKYWKYLVLSIFFTLIFAILNGVSVYLSIPLLDTLFNQGVQDVQQTAVSKGSSFLPEIIVSIKDSISNAFNSFVFSGSKLDALFKICIIIFSAFLLKNIAGYLQAYFLIYVEQGLVRDLRDNAYKHLHTLPLSFFKKERTGNLISVIVNDVVAVQNSVSATFLNLIREPLTIIVFLGIALSISWKLTLLSLIVLPFSLIIISWIGLKLRKYSTKIQEKMADITSIIQETVSGVKIVKAFSMEDAENKKFGKESANFFRLMLKITRVRNVSSPVTEILSVLIGVVIIYSGGVLVLENESIRASQFLGFMFAIFQLMPPVKELSSVNNRIQESSAAADRIFEVIDTPPLISDPPNPVKISGLNSDIKFRNLTFYYDDSNERILENITFDVKKGEVIAIVGPSGGGKTTLVDLIPRFYDPTEGTILIDNVNIKDFYLKELRSKIGIVTQETFLFNDTIANNITYGLENVDRERLIEVAKIANAHSFISELPNGYDQNIGERGVKLSGGQRQRLSIARALYRNPDILIFDEATSALDNESEKLVQEALDRLMKSRTVFVIAHRLSTVRNADKIIVIENGKIVQEGKHNQLLEDETGLYNKLYNLQFKL